jgi:hypothetical protein
MTCVSHEHNGALICNASQTSNFNLNQSFDSSLALEKQTSKPHPPGKIDTKCELNQSPVQILLTGSGATHVDGNVFMF